MYFFLFFKKMYLILFIINCIKKDKWHLPLKEINVIKENINIISLISIF